MDKSITPNQIKQNNRNLIYQYIYNHKKVSQQDISYHLHLSRPTVTTNLTVLEKNGLVQKNGQFETEFAGRKASAYSIVSDYRIAVGLELLKKEIKIIAVNLYGEPIEYSVFHIPYHNDDSYFENVCCKILNFIECLGIKNEQVLGVGIAMQALISPDQQTVIYGKILSCTGLSIKLFTAHLPYSCSFIHDAYSAAISELWTSPQLQDAFYLSLSTHLGAAIISNRKIVTGKHGHNSTIEHIQMEEHGKLCYCGRHGCMETLCSLSALLTADETLDSFFQKLYAGDMTVKERWTNYLTDLAKAINMLHLVYDTDFILGGYLALYLCDEDIRFLHEQIERITPFPESPDFLLISKMPKHNITIGAALPYIQEFLEII